MLKAIFWMGIVPMLGFINKYMKAIITSLIVHDDDFAKEVRGILYKNPMHSELKSTATFEGWGSDQEFDLTIKSNHIFEIDSEYDIEIKITEKPRAETKEHNFK